MIGDGSYTIEVEDESNVWQDVTDLVQSCTDGTGGDGQIVPEVAITFVADVDEELDALLDPETNRGRARIRITEGTQVRYYLLEERSGSLSRSFDVPTISGRAACGVLVDWKKPTYTFPFDLALSSIAKQLCQESVGQGGRTVALTWSASFDPTIPGGRYTITKADRLEVLREIAAAVGGDVRCTVDGLGFEIYDRPARSLPGSVARTYTDALSGSYRRERIDQVRNAVRVTGEVPESSRPVLPVIKVTVFPNSIEGDGSSTATARALVYASNGRPVQHAAVVDQAIDADSYTVIPVSGCFSVQAVWLNTGTQEAPVKGARVEPSTFDASSITVPDNGTDLFIVSYTQAEVVGWALYDYVDQINGEPQDSTGTLSVTVDVAIGRVRGVYRASDTRRIGTNFFEGGSATANGTNKDITLGISPGASGTHLIVDYDEYNATPVGASLSPSSSLCDEQGFAETTVGAGTAIGLAVIEASALGQTGETRLPITGSDIDVLAVTLDPGTLATALGSVDDVVEVTDETDTLKKSTTVEPWPVYYVETDYEVVDADYVNISGIGYKAVQSFDNTVSPPRLYIGGADDLMLGYTVTFSYTGRITQAPAGSVCEVTATVAQDDGTPVTDGTTVRFEIIGADYGCTLSADSATTSDGVASVDLTAGDQPSECVTLRVTSGPLSWQGCIAVKDSPTDAELAASTTNGGTAFSPDDQDCPPGFESNGQGSCCQQVKQDGTQSSGSITGCRRVVDCDGNPISGAWVDISGVRTMTGEDGYFCFTNGVVGSNAIEISVGGKTYTSSFDIAPAGAASRGSGYYTEC